MRVQIGHNGWFLCDSADEPDFEYFEFLGREALALQWLNQFQEDVFVLRTLRRLLGNTFPVPTDEQILKSVAVKLGTGYWKARRRILKPPLSTGPAAPVEAPAFPIAERRRSVVVSTPAPDPPLFPNDIDAAAIAQAQKAAAALGIPFCEECLRAQLQGR
jgi:hypothetical protein